ncbi:MULTISPECIES: hypothetical protein [Brevibacillus]|jgi:hypothetical protein|uniref:Uncharacterized protein n=1 Tax=Brevibacillus parabrevis TaxID=54914 RepID=A0A4Y3PQD6_BREPA|nr:MULTISPECIES: hypothetical protein [Brevibacillus]MDH6351272.1 hypothetical protein [Brevibacillus sp. 1238]MDR4998653.1 hypothetical protein [Brevibacillus parabrevis]MED2254786.1 hypothetical protein [Brevibacillus parabrevis]WDV93968.1 hypothetical protein PSE45_20320 [Brevibacillus parabrevis]GEB34196.1 hypothetical protein BPA01_37760 [Brevibacillus parabrevis]
MKYSKKEMEMIQGTVKSIKIFAVSLIFVVIGLFALKYYIG